MKIIIVEDDPLIKAALEAGLNSLGFEILATTSRGIDALSLVGLHNPDVILLDLDLGDGPTGVDISWGIRRRFDTMGIVILSSYASPRLIGRFLAREQPCVNLDSFPPKATSIDGVRLGEMCFPDQLVNRGTTQIEELSNIVNRH